MHSAGNQCRVRLADGGRPRCLHPSLRSAPSAGVPGRDQPPTFGRRHAAGADGARQGGARELRIRERRCVQPVLLTEPLGGWRHVMVSERRTRIDFAHCIKELVEVHYLDAEKIVLVMDNLQRCS